MTIAVTAVSAMFLLLLSVASAASAAAAMGASTSSSHEEIGSAGGVLTKRKLTGSNPHLEEVGNDGKPKPRFPLGLCQGDCDSNQDCAEGLSCFDDSNSAHVPGCSGERTKNKFGNFIDYCYLAPTPKPSPKPTRTPKPTPKAGLPHLQMVGNNGKPANHFPLGLCEGDCDRDEDCAEPYSCFDDDDADTVPGCTGMRSVSKEGKKNDYCYMGPMLTSQPSAAPSTSNSPSAAPITSNAKICFIYYSMADNNLENALRQDLQELISSDVIRVPEMTTWIYFDGSNSRNPFNPIPNIWFNDTTPVTVKESGSRYLTYSRDLDKMLVDTTLVGEQDSDDPQTVLNFAQHALSDCVAKGSTEYFIVFSDHGGGYAGFGGDDHVSRRHLIQRNNDLAGALRQALDSVSGAPSVFDVIGFDACLVMAFGAADDFDNNITKYYLASEDLEPWEGWAFEQLTDASSAVAMADDILGNFLLQPQGPFHKQPKTLAIIETGRFLVFRSALEALSSELSALLDNNTDPGILAAVNTARNEALELVIPDSGLDIGSFLSAFQDGCGPLVGSPLETLLAKTKAAYNDMFIARGVGPGTSEEYTGMHVFFPRRATYLSFMDYFDPQLFTDPDLATLEAPNWLKFLQSYYGATTPTLMGDTICSNIPISTPLPTAPTPPPTNPPVIPPTPGPTFLPTAQVIPPPTPSPTPGPTVPGQCLVEVDITCVDQDGNPCAPSIPSPPFQCAAGTEIDTVTFVYLGGACDSCGPLNPQDGDAVCTGSAPATGEVQMVCLDDATILFDGTVSLDDTFMVNGAGGGPLPDILTCEARSFTAGTVLQTMSINTSGEASLQLTDCFGSIKLLSCDEKDCLNKVTYTYTISNLGAGPLSLTQAEATFPDGTTTDFLPQIPNKELQVGESATTTGMQVVNVCELGTFTTTAEAEAGQPGGVPCFDSKEYTFTTSPMLTPPPISGPTLGPSGSPAPGPTPGLPVSPALLSGATLSSTDDGIEVRAFVSLAADQVTAQFGVNYVRNEIQRRLGRENGDGSRRDLQESITREHFFYGGKMPSTLQGGTFTATWDGSFYQVEEMSLNSLLYVTDVGNGQKTAPVMYFPAGTIVVGEEPTTIEDALSIGGVIGSLSFVAGQSTFTLYAPNPFGAFSGIDPSEGGYFTPILYAGSVPHEAVLGNGLPYQTNTAMFEWKSGNEISIVTFSDVNQIGDSSNGQMGDPLKLNATAVVSLSAIDIDPDLDNVQEIIFNVADAAEIPF